MDQKNNYIDLYLDQTNMHQLNNYHSYYEFLKLNVNNKPNLPLIVRNAHNIFNSLNNLIKDEDLPSHLRLHCFVALGYFLIPDDIFPEDEHGAIGFIEDVMLAVFVLSEIEDYLGSEGIEIINRSMGDVETTFNDLKLDFELQKEKYERHYLKALHYTGLISDQDYESLI